MNVIWVIHYPTFGGPHNRPLRLAPALASRGVSVTMVLPREEGNASSRLSAAGLTVRRLGLSRLRASRDARLHARFALRFAPEVTALRRLIREARADAVVVGGLVNPHAALAGHLEDVAVVWQVVDTRTPRIACRALTPVVRRCADALQFGAEALIERNFGDARFGCPMTVLRPSVDVDAFRPSAEHRARTRERLGIPPDAVVVGTVANVNPQKGIEWFVRAAGRLASTDASRWFVVVGALPPTHADYLDALRSEIVRCGLDPARFLLVGDQADVERWYPAFDVKLITSVPRSEGTTTTALEALACGVPVVAADVGAVTEVVEDGVSGRVVPAEDASALAEATEHLLDDAAARRQMAAAGRQRVERRFSTDVAAGTQLAIFESAIGHRSARHRRYLTATTK